MEIKLTNRGQKLYEILKAKREIEVKAKAEEKLNMEQNIENEVKKGNEA